MPKSQCGGSLTNMSGSQSGPPRGSLGATQIQTEALPAADTQRDKESPGVRPGLSSRANAEHLI